MLIEGRDLHEWEWHFGTDVTLLVAFSSGTLPNFRQNETKLMLIVLSVLNYYCSIIFPTLCNMKLKKTELNLIPVNDLSPLVDCHSEGF